MFGIDSLDFLEPPKPLPRRRLRRSFLLAPFPVVVVVAVLYGPALLPSGDYSGLLLLLGAIGVNLLICIGLAYLAYQAARKRMDGW